MTTHALLFEAKSIQSYLFGSGRLRDVIGASELIDALTDELLDGVRDALALSDDRLWFTRRAGGAFYAFSEDAAAIAGLRDLYTLAVQHYAPGLAYDLGAGQGDTALEAFDAARDALRGDSSRQRPVLPVAAPITERSRRSGLAATPAPTQAHGLLAPDEQPGEVRLDAATWRRRAVYRANRSGLIQRFSPEPAALSIDDWPRDLTPGADAAFPYLGDHHTLALIHADGNGLGQLLINAANAARARPAAFRELFTALSGGISNATIGAARQATEEILLPARREGEPLAARPILLGGDDLTLLVRSDLALDYLRAFVRAFEAQSQAVLQQLQGLGVERLPPRLTIGAGLVYLRYSQPFQIAIRLTEALTGRAKQAAKPIDADCPPSSLAFHRVAGPLSDDYQAILDQELTQHAGQVRYIHTLGTYYFDHAAPSPRLDDLRALAGLLGADDMARGPTRQLLTLIGQAPAQARSRYQRWRQLMKDNRRERLEKFDRLLESLLDKKPGDDLPYASADVDGRRPGPLGDVIALLGALRGHAAITRTHEDKEDAA